MIDKCRIFLGEEVQNGHEPLPVDFCFFQNGWQLGFEVVEDLLDWGELFDVILSIDAW